MTYSALRNNARIWLAAAVIAGFFLPVAASAQVVVVANGSPITELDIAQRTKLIATSTRKTPSRQDVIQELIDDRIKIAKAKVYGMEVSDAEVNSSFETMAQRQHMNTQQFSQVLERSGILPQTVKARVRAQLTWNQLIRAKFGATLEVSDADVTKALMETKESDTAVGYIYTLYPVVVLAPRGSAEATLRAKLQEAESLRQRFTACDSGLRMARAMRDIAVREPVTRSSSDLPEQFRNLLASIELGHLTQPEPTDQGLQMFAVCNKRQTTADTPAKRQAKEQIFNKRFEVESKRFLDEIRKQAMIEYKSK
ncbi:MAG TPA: SurA N-terminal domain-containing protein [Pseudolabrys sp.]|jgi:peptidyl-prolyl cis-trans isomerase SurA|nr:SurA N-terminal domain-containing protein [Pseudolabrys sp.]